MAGEEVLLAGGTGTGAGGGGLLGGIVGGMADTATSAFFQYLLNQDAYNKNLQMWNAQNRYNSPLEQMKRLTEAGLNPNLVYGNGVTGNSSGSAPQFDAPKVNSIGDGIAKMAQIRNMDATTSNLLTSNDLIRAEASVKKAEAENAWRDLTILKRVEKNFGLPLTSGTDPASMAVGILGKLGMVLGGAGLLGAKFGKGHRSKSSFDQSPK